MTRDAKQSDAKQSDAKQSDAKQSELYTNIFRLPPLAWLHGPTAYVWMIRSANLHNTPTQVRVTRCNTRRKP
jgi:hypothetical protein